LFLEKDSADSQLSILEASRWYRRFVPVFWVYLVKASLLEGASKFEEEVSLAFLVDDMGLSRGMFMCREGREERWVMFRRS